MWSLEQRVARERLELAGIDADTLEVADERRWAFAVDYMRARETFKVEEFKRWLEEHEEPSVVPAGDVPSRPHPMAKKKETLNPVAHQINRRIQGCVG